MGHEMKPTNLAETSFKILQPIIDELNEGAAWKDVVQVASKSKRFCLRFVCLLRHPEFFFT